MKNDSKINLKMLDIILKNSTDGVLVVDVETKKFVFANLSMRKMLGYTKKEFLKLGIPNIHKKKDLPWVIKEFEDIISVKKKLNK